MFGLGLCYLARVGVTAHVNSLAGTAVFPQARLRRLVAARRRRRVLLVNRSTNQRGLRPWKAGITASLPAFEVGFDVHETHLRVCFDRVCLGNMDEAR